MYKGYTLFASLTGSVCLLTALTVSPLLPASSCYLLFMAACWFVLAYAALHQQDKERQAV